MRAAADFDVPECREEAGGRNVWQCSTSSLRSLVTEVAECGVAEEGDEQTFQLPGTAQLEGGRGRGGGRGGDEHAAGLRHQASLGVLAGGGGEDPAGVRHTQHRVLVTAVAVQAFNCDEETRTQN